MMSTTGASSSAAGRFADSFMGFGPGTGFLLKQRSEEIRHEATQIPADSSLSAFALEQVKNAVLDGSGPVAEHRKLIVDDREGAPLGMELDPASAGFNTNAER